NGQFLREVLVPATSMTDSGLAGSTTYSYSVEAVDNAGNRSAQSGAVNSTTPVCPAPAQDWVRSFGGALSDNGQVVATDSSGNIFLGGHFGGTVDFGAGRLSSDTTYALYIAKFRN